MTDIDLFVAEVQSNAERSNIIGLQLYKPKNKSSNNNLKAKLVQLKSGLHLQISKKVDQNPVFENIPLNKISTWLRNELISNFYEAQVQTTDQQLHFLSNKKGRTHFKKSKAQTAAPTLTHNRIKKHIIQKDRAPYLQALKIANKDGSIKNKMQGKFRQMNRYIEYVDVLLRDVNLEDIETVVDMGSGKGYLSFALYAHLLDQGFDNPLFLGVERRADLVQLCNQIADDLNYQQLIFMASDIANAHLPDMDLMIALHACDTATDDALLQALKSNAKLIVASPCCHKQLRPQMNAVPALQSILEHGIYQDRFAEMLTDSTRVELLKKFGYKCKIVEFISSEHTAKNSLILAHREQHIQPTQAEILELSAQLKQYGISEMKLIDEILLNAEFLGDPLI